MDPLLLHITNTTRFLLPLIVKNGITYKKIQTNLINCYMSAFDMSTFSECIFTIYNEDIQIDYIEAELIVYSCKFNEEHEEYDYIYVYKIDDNLLEDYFEFINGNYSKISDTSKQKILAFWEAGNNTILYSILYKDKTNIEIFVKEHILKNNPQQDLYTAFVKNYKPGKELYKSPNLKKEMYGYNSEL